MNKSISNDLFPRTHYPTDPHNQKSHRDSSDSETVSSARQPFRRRFPVRTTEPEPIQLELNLIPDTGIRRRIKVGARLWLEIDGKRKS